MKHRQPAMESSQDSDLVRLVKEFENLTARHAANDAGQEACVQEIARLRQEHEAAVAQQRDLLNARQMDARVINSQLINCRELIAKEMGDPFLRNSDSWQQACLDPERNF